MTTRTRRLSLRAAQDCENAVHSTCKCRCGGAYHGAARNKDVRQLPLDDPHSPSEKCSRCSGSGKLQVWTGIDETVDAPVFSEVACWKCEGKGRTIPRSVQRAALADSLPLARDNGNKFGVEVVESRTDVWWCAKCKAEWTVPSLPHNPACPTCGRGGWWRRFV